MTQAFYTPLPPEAGFELCQPVEGKDFETLNLALAGVEKGEGYRTPPMHLIRKDGRKSLAESDSPWLGGHALIFRERASEALRSILEPCGELLPVDCRDASLLIYNVTRVIDALDESSSELVRFSSGRVMGITRYAFRPELIAGVDAFKIPNLRVSRTFLSARFVQAWKDNGLRGLDFQQVWAPSHAG